jgi:hypothetical protein
MTEISNAQIGGRGGRIVSEPPKRTPPPEMAAQVEREKVVQRAGLENAVARYNKEELAIESFDLAVDPFRNIDFQPKNPKAGEEVEYQRFQNAFFSMRPNISGVAVLRSDSILRCVTEPFYIVKGASARAGMTREVLPPALFDLFSFLQNYEPVNGVSTDELAALCEIDKDHLNEVRIEPPKPTSLQDVLDGLAKVLTPKPVTA